MIPRPSKGLFIKILFYFLPSGNIILRPSIDDKQDPKANIWAEEGCDWGVEKAPQ